MTVCILAFLLLALEELFFKLNSRPVTRCIDPWTHSIDHEDTVASRRVTLFLRWIRMVQLLVLGAAFAMVAASAGSDILFTTQGQLAGLILLLQLARIVTRKVVDQWSVLRVVVIMQAALLVILAFFGLDTPSGAVPPYRPLDWLMSASAFLGLFLLSVSAAFGVTYFLRLASREGSPFYYSVPPLAFSEYWIRRMIRVSALVSGATLVLHAVLRLFSGYPAGPGVLQAALLAAILPSLILFRDGERLHHSAAVSLSLGAWVINAGWSLAGFAATSGGWFV